MRREHIVNQIREIVHRVAPKPTYDEENEVRWPLYELEIKTGVSINPYIISRKSWENRPFKTPFYVNVVNEGVVL